MRGVLITAPASGQGKTVVTLGLLRSLRDRGIAVASGKSGPDYIDPAFHAAATGRPCVTLDAWSSEPDALRGRARMHTRDGSTDMIVVEGAMGAFDGAAGPSGPGAGSAAGLAAALDVPMILVLDASHMAQSAGAIVHGIAAWSERAGAHLAGVLLNRIGSARHDAIVREAVSTECRVLGAIPREAGLVIPSRHLGLVQAVEQNDLQSLIEKAAITVASHCDLDAILEICRPIRAGSVRPIKPLGQRIAVARDQAFGFSYWHMIEDWRDQGAEVVFFSPLEDGQVDDAADAVFLPGGYPELHAGRLAAAEQFRGSMFAAKARGALIYGECGGYMVLGQGLVDATGARHAMLGLLAVETTFADRRLHLGYRRLSIESGPWSGAAFAHEFHYATTLAEDGRAFGVATDASGSDPRSMGLVDGRVMGSFAHVIELG